MVAGDMTVKIEITADDQATSTIEGAAATAGGAFDQLTDKASKFSQSCRQIGKTMAIAGGAMVGSITGATAVAAAWGDEMEETAQKTGIASKELQFYQYAANLTGGSLESFTGGLRFLQKNMVAAASGSGDAAQAFKDMGVTVTNADGSMRSSSDLMPEIADGIAKISDPAKRTAVAMQVFGRGGTSMLPMLVEGSAGLAKLRGGFEEAGGAVDTVELGGLQDDLDSLKQSAMTIIRVFGSVMAPIFDTLAKTVTRVAGSISHFAKQHQGLVRIVGFSVLVIGMLLSVLGPVLYLLPGIANGIKFVSLAFRGASLATTGFGATLWTALAPILPILLPIVAVIAIVGGAIYLLWKKSEAFRTFVTGMWERVRAVFGAMWTFVSGIISKWGKYLIWLLGPIGWLIKGLQALIWVADKAFGWLNKVMGFKKKPEDEAKQTEDATKDGASAGLEGALGDFKGGEIPVGLDMGGMPGAGIALGGAPAMAGAAAAGASEQTSSGMDMLAKAIALLTDAVRADTKMTATQMRMDMVRTKLDLVGEAFAGA